MSNLNFNKIANLRQEKHFLGRQKMAEGQYHEALEVFTSAYADFGSHVLLLGDIIACQVLLGRLADGFQSTQWLEEEMRKAEGILSQKTLAKSYIFLGKLYEEQALLDEAWRCFEQGLKFAKNDPETCSLAQAQILRLSAFCENKEIFESIYQICFQSRPNSACLKIELEHGLILGELSFMGFDSASARLDMLLDNKNLLAADRQLLIIDFLEFLLVKKIPTQEFILKYKSQVNSADFDTYEASVWNLANFHEPASFSLLNQLSSRLPLLSLLKIHYLSFLYINESQRAEISRRIDALIMPLSKKSQKFLRKKWKMVDLDNDGRLTIVLCQRHILCAGSSLPVKPNSQSVKILKIFFAGHRLPTSEFIKLVFEMAFDEYSFERTRKGIERVNALIFRLTGIEKAITISKTEIVLSAEIHFTALAFPHRSSGQQSPFLLL